MEQKLRFVSLCLLCRTEVRKSNIIKITVEKKWTRERGLQFGDLQIRCLVQLFFRFLYVCGRLILFPSFKVEKKKNFQQEVATSAKKHFALRACPKSNLQIYLQSKFLTFGTGICLD